MKKIFLIALSAMVIISYSCSGKGGDDVPTESYIDYDGEVYALRGVASYFENGMTMVAGELIDTLVDGQRREIFPEIYVPADAWNDTVDLMVPSNYPYDISVIGDMNITASCTEGDWRGMIGDDFYEHDMLKQGTLQLIRTERGAPIFIRLDCTLINDKRLQLQIYVPVENQDGISSR